MTERHFSPSRGTLPVALPLVAAWLLGACGQPRALSLPVATGCPLVAAADSSDPAWPLTIAMGPDLYPVVVSEPGFPGTRPQRFTTHQVGETLIRLDCRGDAVAGLAATWSVDSSGYFWTFALRPDARFADGTSVTVADVSRSFAEVRTPRPWTGSGGMLVGWAGIRRATLRGDTALVLEFTEARRTVPSVLAHSALVTIKQTTGNAVGSGPFWVTAASDGRVRLAAESGATTSLTVVTGDLRDALDAGVDVVVTRDPRTLGYAAGLEEYSTIPLSWSDQYVLVTADGSGRPARISLDALRLEQIVRVSARSPVTGERTPWWNHVGHCGLAGPDPRAATETSPRLVYDAADAVARSVAERLVAVGVTEQHLVAAGVAADQFRATIRAGADWGYVVRLPTLPLAPCLVADQVLAYAPWLELSPGAAGLTALIEVRSHAVVRPHRIVGRVELDWQGALVILPISDGGGR